MDLIIPIKDRIIQQYTDQVKDKSTLKTVFRTNTGYATVQIPQKAVPGGFVLNTEARIFWEDIPYGLCILKVRSRLSLGFGTDAARIDTGDRQDDRMAPKIYAKGIYQGWSA